jgi:hypothetical protein
MFTLPNITIEEPLEIDGVAMVPAHDARARALAKRHKRFSMYLNRFTSEFGQQVNPSLILVKADKFRQYRTVEALAGFRDAGLFLFYLPNFPLTTSRGWSVLTGIRGYGLGRLLPSPAL